MTQFEIAMLYWPVEVAWGRYMDAFRGRASADAQAQLRREFEEARFEFEFTLRRSWQ